MEKIDLRLLKTRAEKEIEKSRSLKELDGIFKKYLGKKGEITQLFKSLKKLPEEKRAKIGREVNELKNFLKIRFDQKVEEIKEKIKRETEEKEWIDITLPGKKPVLGHLHPLTLVKRKIEEIFQVMGFKIVEGPEIETEWYNFDALNIPKEHPARDFWDTLYLKNSKLLLRTHTSPVQIRFMEKNQPPLRIIVPGRVFRHEATDASHEINFYQLEGLMVGKDISAANFRAIIEEFFKRFFQKNIKIRLRPSYFPFTEPSFEVDISCLVCQGKGCPACAHSGWVEMMGAGMVHPNVFKNSGLNPKFWQGFAFGLGLDRLVMMKYKISDIRLFYSGDLRFLNQF
ncbi:MAG: phenylalanine--tRNA ligase subunit alpha [Patescibacteria group bacterium]|nr:phenylalanine--tRNA ligase subunit alpha [Patescibacteria group bacterium]